MAFFLYPFLQKKIQGEFPFTIAVPLQPKSKEKHWLSFNAQGTKVKTSVQYKKKFLFNINVHTRISISERLFPFQCFFLISPLYP